MPWPAGTPRTKASLLAACVDDASAKLGHVRPTNMVDTEDEESESDNEDGAEEEGSPYLNIVVEGCCHGALDEIYRSVAQIERNRAVKVDLLLCCGDFQALRNEDDYDALAVPPKYRAIGSFYKYYTGERTAPVPTIVIGGNHEASNYMSDLFHGGWLAPNIYYLGAAGVVTFGGVRIGGISGIFKKGDYQRGHFEHAP